MNELTIKIREGDEMTVEELINGVKSFKRIEPDALLECIKHSIARNGVSSGLLPRGCLSYYQSDDGVKGVCLLFQESKANISYFGTVYKDFPLPRLVFGFSVSAEGRVSGCRMGVVANDDVLKPTSKMYRYPLSNVNGFHLCTGNNTLPKCKSLHTLASLPYFIMEMPNNNDHFEATNNKQGLEMRDLLEFLKDKTPDYYYSDVLIPFGSATLEDFIDDRGVF